MELELPKSVKIHPVVNVSRVHRYREQVVEQKVILSPSIIIEGKEKYEVEKILSKVENLGNAWKALRDYERRYKESARRIRKEKDSTYYRSKLPGRYTAKMLYR